MTFEEAKQQAIEWSEWVLCHGAGYYTARTPDGRDIIGKGENGVFVGGEYRRIVVRVHKATESIEECLEAFFSACCEDVKYAQSQEYFADFAENNEFKFYENGICIRHR